MRKEELRKLRALPATKEMMEKGKEVAERKGVVYGKIKRSKYDFLMRVQNLGNYIKAAVFLPEDMQSEIRTPRYEIFINTEGGEWITRELDEEGKEERWSEAMICNLPGVIMWSYYSTANVNIYITPDGYRTLNRLEVENHTDRKGAYRLQQWQQEKRDREIARKEAREQAPWDADMKLVPRAPKGFKEWMRKDVCDEVFIIYDYGDGRVKEGYCSRCKKRVPVKKPRHNKETRCPACRAEARYKASGKIKSLYIKPYDAEIIQKLDGGGIVIRRFEQWQNYFRKNNYTEPNIFTNEYKRTLIFDSGEIREYSWRLYKNKKERWCREQFNQHTASAYWYACRTKLYKRNWSCIKKTTLLKNSAIDLWEELPTSVTDYIRIEKGNPAVEMLAKIGMFKLAKELMRKTYDAKLLDEGETEIAKLLKIDNARLKRLKAMDGGVDALRWLQLEKIRNTIWPDEMIRDFVEAEFKTSVFNFLKPSISFVKCHNYLKKQMLITGEDMLHTLITWRDYINMADQMKMNTGTDQIAKPKNVKEAHDRLVLLNQRKGVEQQAGKLEKKFPKVNEQLPKLQKFEYELGDYCIVAPKKIIDIVMEGVILGHCVHTCDYYFSRIQTDESYLFFLRKKCSPDMPWYTLEVEPSGNIRQKRTTGDKQNKDFEAALPFLRKWQRYFKKQLTREEVELGEKANLLRKEGYKKLRQDGNRVWHGPLAGKLLADVLEADFMEAI